MKILFVSPSYKPAYVYGGPAVSVSELAEALASAGHAVTIYTTTANGEKELDVQPGVPLQLNGVTVYYFKRQTGDHTHVSFGLWRKLYFTASAFDVINLQSWWSVLIFGAAFICRLKKRIYFVSPRGMLSSYSFEKQHSFTKKLLHRFFGRSLLNQSRLHATTLLEWNDCLQVNDSWRGFILPNLVRFPLMPGARPGSEKKDDELIFGFLSRIDQKKGLELLMQALAEVNFNYRLKIAGAGQEDYINSLKELASRLGIDKRVEWCGWKNGDEKFIFLQEIDVFVLTSYNENFANTVIESLIMGTPVLLSEGVGLSDYVEKNELGWVCQTNVPSIRDGLLRIFSEQHKFDKINEVAPAVIQRDFNKETLAQNYGEAYGQFI